MPRVLSYPPKAPAADSQHVLVYFVPGNPGYIDYYEPFLSTLHSLLEEGSRPTSFHVVAHDLSGFDDADHEPFGRENPPRDIEDEVRYTLDNIDAAANGLGVRFDHVIVMGHSLGAYIALEVFHRRKLGRPSGGSREEQQKHKQESCLPTAGILLFPTVTHIAESPSGRRLGLLLRVLPSSLAEPVCRLLQTAAAAVPGRFLGWLLQHVLRFSPHAATATVRFLHSRDGIWQSLYLARDEIRSIGEDQWEKELWEAKEEGAKFVFYYVERDHWVSNKHRDLFVQKRREHAEGRTKILVERDTTPHAFCIHHSETVAEKVKVWIDEIVGV